MASILRAPLSLAPQPRLTVVYLSASRKPLVVSFKQLRKPRAECLQASLRIGSFAVRASSEEATARSAVVEEEDCEDDSDAALEAIGDAEEDASDSDQAEAVEASFPCSPVIAALQSYKEALASNDEAKISETESFFKSLEDEKINLEGKVAILSLELSTERDRILRISADFENFRRRTERERLSLVENAQGEVAESLLPVLDNFERAKAQLNVGTEGEEKISNSYQSIYKQFIEILNSLRVTPVETTGTAFDPLEGNHAGLKFSRVLDQFVQRLNKAYSGLVKSWVGF
uniref:GrpE protein homolog n=1 Tax=Kalanchoe fedtschenkoi TaxID=63787 RepID=A0A7N0TIH7_KALFE